jgi:hypothetical protein
LQNDDLIDFRALGALNLCLGLFVATIEYCLDHKGVHHQYLCMGIPDSATAPVLASFILLLTAAHCFFMMLFFWCSNYQSTNPNPGSFNHAKAIIR